MILGLELLNPHKKRVVSVDNCGSHLLALLPPEKAWFYYSRFCVPSTMEKFCQNSYALLACTMYVTVA